jgi:hypothetical protein
MYWHSQARRKLNGPSSKLMEVIATNFTCAIPANARVFRRRKLNISPSMMSETISAAIRRPTTGTEGDVGYGSVPANTQRNE